MKEIKYASVPVQVKLITPKGSTSGEIQVAYLSKQERLRRSLRTLGIGWAIALGSIILPLVHYIAVPLFLFGSPIAAWWIYGPEALVLGGSGLCPTCGAKIDFVKSNLKWPLHDLCSKCQNEIRIEDTTAKPVS